MRLHLPSLLLTAILATFPSFTASAAVVGTGVSYDNGKGSYPYSKDDAAHNLPGTVQKDTLYCWANSAANMIQYWQDSYGEAALTNTAPDGYNETVYKQPYGTRYLNVYEYYLQHGLKDKGGNQKEAINWYFRQTPIEDGTLKINEQSFMKTGMGAPDVISKYYGGGFWEYGTPQAALTDLTTTLETVFSKQGQAVGLAIWQQDPADVGREWEDLQSRSHAVTCWGYEKDAEGNVNALYLSDSDDMTYGVFKVHLTLGQSIPLGGMPSWDAFILQTDDRLDGYGGYVVNLTDLYAISPNTETTPEEGVTAYKDYVQDATPLPALDSAEDAQTVKVLVANTIVSGAVTRTGAGVQVGKDAGQAAPDIVMLVSEDAESSLTLTGDYEGNGTGLDVKQGSLASVANLNVSGYERGVNAEGKVYLYGETVNVIFNELSNDSNGAGIHNTNYVEIHDSGEVTISLNSTNGKGGGIYNGENATLSIRGNGEVYFSFNKADGGGNDIYNAKGASLNIADNGSVIFSGMYYTDAAVVNEGEMYVKSGQEPADVEFRDSSLDSSQGTTYLGRDINGNTSATTVTFTANDWEPEIPVVLAQLEITGGQDGIAAELEHLTVDAYSIMGAGDSGGVVSNALITSLGGMTMSDLQLDTTDSVNTLGRGFTHLDNVALTLTNDDKTGNTFDLTSVFTGNLTLKDVVFDLSSTTLTGDALKDITFDLSKAYVDMAHLDLSFKVAQGQVISFVDSGSTVLLATAPLPEPTTGTLSLLALAGLAARRRRK